MNKNILIQSKCLSIFHYAILFHLLLYFNCDIYAADTSSSHTDKINIELFTGNTMGTTYHIKVVMQKNKGGQEGWNKNTITTLMLHDLIKAQLKQVNQGMSVYLPNSEISLFNKAGKGELIRISPEFYEVMVIGQKLYTITKGAWDGTVKPLVDLWGFGTKKEIDRCPSSEIIKAHLQTIGFNQIIIGNGICNVIVGDKTFQTLAKKNDSITLDLGSIAKGFGVDAIAKLLKSQGYSNFMVEIGGEVFASGTKIISEQGKPWMVGISKPDKGKSSDPDGQNGIYRALPLRDKALATSGDYMSFTTIQGKNYSHIINPATGYPVDNGVVSASVIADNCTFADGLATALMVMGHEKGIELVNSLENVECLIVVRNKEGRLQEYKSKNFPESY